METFTITLGTTAINLWLLLTNQAVYSGASVQGSRKMSTPNASLCRELIIRADDANAGIVYIGDGSGVSSSDYGMRLLAMEEHRTNLDTLAVPLTQWLVASTGNQKVHVKIVW